MLKLLVERTSSSQDNKSGNADGRQGKKRRKLSDRVPLDAKALNLAIAVGAGDIFSYLYEEKGVVPNLETIKMTKQVQVSSCSG